MLNSTNSNSPTRTRDYLWPQLRELPYFRALLRAVEARFYEEIELPRPILDVGCGDGHFAQLTFDHRLDVGVDPWGPPIKEAVKRGIYGLTIQGDAAQTPFPNATFGSAMSNSVLEHIPHVEAVLKETARVLKPGAPFAFCVPNHQFLSTLSVGRGLDRVKLHPLADAYRSFFNRISRHEHSDPPEVWQRRLEEAGFHLERWWHYFPPAALAVLEWGHYFGLPSVVAKKLSGRWIVSPTRWNLYLTERLTRPHYNADPHSEQGVYTFYVARRI
ncbi:MAG: class I SAM-dependent methyltransferase [Chloroflexota bacterium]